MFRSQMKVRHREGGDGGREGGDSRKGGWAGGFGLVYWGLTPRQQPGSYQGWAGGRKGKGGRKFYLGGRN